ncbi:hypothetical protein FACS189426_20920 [Bacteroidia bacterium]|nr:hypothetical protein FACS189426_20920 [Bacteroidia bacterium]GHV70285.1 hypothetical protein FACS189420_0740 [Bacteroidia bacterium]
MDKIIIIARFKLHKTPVNFAVWNALKLHVNFLIDSKFSPIFYVKDDLSLNVIEKEYGEYPVFKYKNAFSLLSHLKKNKDILYIWTPDLLSVWESFLSKFFLHKKIICWLQGILPEESYMRNNSKIRFYALSLLEKYALKMTDKQIFVSETMRNFYENKYKIKFKDYIIIPCISELKYNSKIQKFKNSFVYIGGLSVWQCFDKILYIFSQIQSLIPDAILHIITPEVEKAKDMSSSLLKHTDNVSIYHVSERNLLSDILSHFEYGFLIRENNAVNKVASPIKFAEYLSCGVNVIMTNSIPHFAELLKANKVGIILDETLHISDSCIFNYNKEDILHIYHENFDSEKQIIQYSTMLHD